MFTRFPTTQRKGRAGIKITWSLAAWASGRISCDLVQRLGGADAVGGFTNVKFPRLLASLESDR